MSDLKRKKTSYEVGFKLRVVEHAELHVNSNAMNNTMNGSRTKW